MFKRTSVMSFMAFIFTLSSSESFAQVASPNVVITELNGQQVFQGDGGYDQIDYDGNSANYTFVRNGDRSVSVTKPDGVTDRLINIDGGWFAGEQEWYSIDTLATASTQAQTITGTAGTYDQVDYPGRASDYTFVRNSDVSVSVTKPNGGVDTLINIDGFWFGGEARWYAIGSLVEAFAGNRTITGTADYDQVDYPGAATDYTFTQNNNGSVNVAKPDGNTDTLIDIDGFWFQGEAAWYGIESLLIPGNRTINGTTAYDQVDYDGNRSDYTFIENANGTVSVFRPDGFTDTLSSIDGFWFSGEEAWYSIEGIFDTGFSTDRNMAFSSHYDDDIIFMNNDILRSIQRGEEVTTVYFTDSGSVQSTTTREQGMRDAYAEMAGFNNWVNETVTINNRPVARSYLRNNANGVILRLYFLRVPNAQAQPLWEGNINSVTTLFGVNYDRQGLINTVTALMEGLAPNNIRTHARRSTTLSGSDHSDHRHDAEFTWAAMRQYNGSFDIDEYIGYGVASLPANVTGTEYDTKFSIFETYAQSDPQALTIPVFREYLARQMYIGPDGQPTTDDWDLRSFPALRDTLLER